MRKPGNKRVMTPNQSPSVGLCSQHKHPADVGTRGWAKSQRWHWNCGTCWGTRVEGMTCNPGRGFCPWNFISGEQKELGEERDICYFFSHFWAINFKVSFAGNTFDCDIVRQNSEGAPTSRKFPIPGSAGCSFEKPSLVKGVSAHDRGVGMRWDLSPFQIKPLWDSVKIAHCIWYIFLHWRTLMWVCSEALWLQIRSCSKEYLQISRVNGSWPGDEHHPHDEMSSLQDASVEGNKYGLWIFWALILKKSRVYINRKGKCQSENTLSVLMLDEDVWINHNSIC